MNDVVINDTDKYVITSMEVAGMLKMEHKYLMRSIRKYAIDMQSAKISPCPFWEESSYSNDNGQTYPCYEITKLGCEFLAHKTPGEKGTLFTARYIQKFHEMENVLQDKQTPTIPAAIPTCALAKNKQKTWSEKNLWKFQKICKDMDWELKYLYHKILLELNDMYNMDFYQNDYHNKYNAPPKYNMDIINEYFELQQMADKYLEYLMSTFGETLV